MFVYLQVIQMMCDMISIEKSRFEIVPVKTSVGDVNLSDPLYTIGGVGVFTKQVE